jgi:uncharacterized protein
MVPMKDIRAFSRRIAERFKPRRIILFGSYAYGTPTEDSDVDLFVVMPPRTRELETAVDIRLAVEGTFPMDVVVWTPASLRKRLARDDQFVKEALEKGKVLYEA